MQLRNFIDLSEATIARLAPKLNANPSAGRYVQSVQRASYAGEWQIALETLVDQLAQHRIPVSAQDYRDLDALFAHLEKSASEDVRSRAEESRADLGNVNIDQSG
jgi:hypothetical protein